MVNEQQTVVRFGTPGVFPSTPIRGCTDLLVRAPSKAGIIEIREGLTKAIWLEQAAEYYRSFPDLKYCIAGLACMYDVTNVLTLIFAASM